MAALKKNVDLLDVGVFVIVIIAMLGLLVGHPTEQISDLMTNIIWAGLAGLGMKKLPQTL